MPSPGLTGEVKALVDDFVLKLKSRQIKGSLLVAKKTVEILRNVISQQRLSSNSASAIPLIEGIKMVGRRLVAASPMDLGIGNIVRRVLHIIREEEATLTNVGVVGSPPPPGLDDEALDTVGRMHSSPAAVAAANRSVLRAPSLTNLLEQVVAPPRPRTQDSSSIADSEASLRKMGPDNKPLSWHLKHNVLAAVNELLEEVQSFHEQIAAAAMEHIHQNEVIMTLGRSKTVADFLIKAGRNRFFQVVIAEGAPGYEGHELARTLAESLGKAADVEAERSHRGGGAGDAERPLREGGGGGGGAGASIGSKGIQATVITDSAVFALMARVNMVIVGAHAVMANGGVIAPIGVAVMAAAAKQHRVPFVVLAGLHKLCPAFPQDPDTLLNELGSPAEVIEFGAFAEEHMDGATGAVRMRATSPAFDYIPPEHVSLFITDTGGHNPSYVYRLVAEYYSPEDYVL